MPAPFLDFFSFFFTKTKFTSKKLYIVLNEYEICLKMLEMAILETHIFKVKMSGGACPQTPLESWHFRHSLYPSSFESPGPARNITSPAVPFNLGISVQHILQW